MIGLPRSTFYYRSTARQVELSDDKVAEMINTIQDEFPGYGYRRVTRELAVRGACINHKRAARIMRERGLYAVTKPKFSPKPKSGDEDGGVFPNLYRNTIPNALDRMWVADFTYIRLEDSFAYLAAFLDACSRKVVGYAISRSIDTQLALAALGAAVRSRRPQPGQCIVHTDRGCQFTSSEYRRALMRHGLIGSMSAPANPYDNAQAESFMKTLKAEEVYLAGYETFEDVAARLPRFIDDVYNAKRMHSSIGYQSPNAYEAQLAQRAA